MRKWKLYIPILLIFVCLLLFLGCNLGWFGVTLREITPANLQFRDETHDMTLVPYYDEAEDTYFLFLPACTAPSDVTITNTVTKDPVAFFQEDVFLGADLSAPPPGENVTLTISGKNYAFQLWQCDNIPTMFLQGKPDFLTKVHADKSNKVRVQATLLDENGQILLQDIASMSGRGNGTWSNVGIAQAKRPYNLSFSSPVSFGSFENLSDLCLFAEYSDESKLRNSLVYFAGQALGIDFASPYTYTNVYVNGEYLGLYGITTKKEYTKHTFQMQDVFECTSIYENPSFTSGWFGQPIKVMYGSTFHAETIVNQLEAALNNQDWEQCEALIDLDSFSLMYVLQEFFCNIDMSYASQYFYIDQEDVLHTMLPWDFDYSMGSAITHFNPNQDRAIMAYRNLMGYSWYPVLLQWDGFRQRAADTLEQYFTNEFLEELNFHLLQDIRAIEASRDCDLRRWKTAEPFTDSPISSGLETLPQFYDFFADCFPKRRDFLLDYFQNFPEYCCITLRSWDGVWYNNVCIPKGSCPSDYIDEAAFLRRLSTDDSLGLFLATQSGVPLAEVETVTEDLTFIVTWQ